MELEASILLTARISVDDMAKIGNENQRLRFRVDELLERNSKYHDDSVELKNHLRDALAQIESIKKFVKKGILVRSPKKDSIERYLYAGSSFEELMRTCSEDLAEIEKKEHEAWLQAEAERSEFETHGKG